MTAWQNTEGPRPVKLTVADFFCLDEAGAFHQYPKTELIDGTVVAMNAQFSTHARVKTRLLRRLAEAVDGVLSGYEAWVEVAIAIPPFSMPEPDIVVTSFQAIGRAPVPVETIALVVEVSDTTRDYDLGTKAGIYAAAGIPEYWVADISREVVHQLWSPAGDDYSHRRTVPFGDVLTAATNGGLTVDTARL